MSIWIVLAILAVMAALLIYAACCVDGDIDRQCEAHPPKSEKGRDNGKVLGAYRSIRETWVCAPAVCGY